MYAASQAGCRGFEPRRPLHEFKSSKSDTWKTFSSETGGSFGGDLPPMVLNGAAA